jgi:protein TonB
VLSPAFCWAQEGKPIEKEGLFEAVRLCGPRASELVRGIQTNGVAFRLTTDDEQALTRLKADPQVLEAVRANYRGPDIRAPLPDGPPLSAEGIISLLRARRDEAWITSLVLKRGVDFALTLPVGRTILAAGGSIELIGVLVLNFEDPMLYTGSSGSALQGPPLRLTREELAWKLRRTEKPDYPLQARRLALTGSVVLEVEIDQSGALKAFGKSSGHPILVDAAKNAVRRWQWEPTLINRVPVEVASEVVVEFVR